MRKKKWKWKWKEWTLAVIVLLSCIWPDDALYAAAGVENAKPMVIVLDPGHGGYDGGACRRWGGKNYYEKSMNLAIAKACKSELEKYSGVKVYLTRSSDYFVTLKKRVAIAKQKKADLFVCLHNNAAENSRANGACVYYPNSGLNAEIGRDGRELASCIQNRLVTNCGLKNNGILFRNSDNGTRYRDRSSSDYYQVIRGSKMEGFPGVIVEHAFVSNASDCRRFLENDARLRKLGAADAAGIADYFGLVKVDNPVPVLAVCGQNGRVTVNWKSDGIPDKQVIYRRKTGEGSYTKVKTIENPETCEYTDSKVRQGSTYAYRVVCTYQGRHGYVYNGVSAGMSVSVPLPEPETPEPETSQETPEPETSQETLKPETSQEKQQP